MWPALCRVGRPGARHPVPPKQAAGAPDTAPSRASNAVRGPGAGPPAREHMLILLVVQQKEYPLQNGGLFDFKLELMHIKLHILLQALFPASNLYVYSWIGTDS